MNPSKTIALGIIQAFGFLVAVGILLYLLYQIQIVFVYLIVALILSLIGNPIQEFLRFKLKFNNTFATIGTMVIFVLFITGFILMFIPLILSQGQSLSLLNTAEIEKNIRLLVTEIKVFLENHHIDSSGMLSESNLASKLDFNFVPTLLNSVLGTISSFGIGLASVLFIVFFFLKDKRIFINAIKWILPDPHEEKILNSIHKTNHLLTRYFIGILIQLSIVFVLYLVVLLIFGIDNFFVIAFLCAILNVIPYVGPLIASILAAVLTMISNLGQDFQSHTLPLTIYVLLGFWLVQIIDNNICQPIIFSNSVKSHPLEIFLVILIAGFLFGITGMIVAIPLYTILKVIGKEFIPENKIVQLLTKNI